MINVTLGEVKTQEEKPFPKIMLGDSGTIIQVFTKPNDSGHSSVFNINTNWFSNEFRVIGGAEIFTDYNEPIILQNA